MVFKPGQSGNPGGRTQTYLQIRDLAQKASPAAFRTLKKLAKKARSETAQIQAANAILDRAFGKPAQAVTGEGGTGPITATLNVTFINEHSDRDDHE